MLELVRVKLQPGDTTFDLANVLVSAYLLPFFNISILLALACLSLDEMVSLLVIGSLY